MPIPTSSSSANGIGMSDFTACPAKHFGDINRLIDDLAELERDGTAAGW
jgi:hypothetical protein